MFDNIDLAQIMYGGRRITRPEVEEQQKRPGCCEFTFRGVRYRLPWYFYGVEKFRLDKHIVVSVGAWTPDGPQRLEIYDDIDLPKARRCKGRRRRPAKR